MFDALFYEQEFYGLGGASVICCTALSLPPEFNLKSRPEASVECKWWGPVLDAEVTMGNGFACRLQESLWGSLHSYGRVICPKGLRNLLNFFIISWSKDTVSLGQLFPKVCV